jgi:hypothetical protein
MKASNADPIVIIRESAVTWLAREGILLVTLPTEGPATAQGQPQVRQSGTSALPAA